MLHFAFFFLRISVASWSKITLVPLWTLGSFGKVASWNKHEFRSGLWRALEGSLLGTKSRSALDFVELWRACFSKQNCVPLWTEVEEIP